MKMGRKVAVPKSLRKRFAKLPPQPDFNYHGGRNVSFVVKLLKEERNQMPPDDYIRLMQYMQAASEGIFKMTIYRSLDDF